MKASLKRFALAVFSFVSLSVLLPGSGVAGEVSFRCKVTQRLNHDVSVPDLDEPMKGPLLLRDEKLKEGYAHSQYGGEFEVNRETGKIVGGILDNDSDASDVIVLDGPGSKFLTMFNRPGGAMEFLVIYDYIDGSTKPFIALSSLNGVVAGLCD